MRPSLTTEARVALERRLLDDLSKAKIVDVISSIDADGCGVKVEQIGIQLPNEDILFLCPENPEYLTIIGEHPEPDIFEPVEYYDGVD